MLLQQTRLLLFKVMCRLLVCAFQQVTELSVVLFKQVQYAPGFGVVGVLGGGSKFDCSKIVLFASRDRIGSLYLESGIARMCVSLEW